MSSLRDNPQMRTMQILWGALCSSHVIFAGLLWFLRFSPQATMHPGHSPPAIYLPMFGAVALIEVVMSFVLPRMALQTRLRSLSSKPGEDISPRLLLPVLQTGLILGLALCESITLLGFVLGFLGAPVEHFGPFFGVGFGLALTRMPTESWVRAQLPGRDTL